ncbi:MAG TPA: hypothetical protein V6D17_08110 [Candidatus Obscuribacterales bacterium]
MASHLPGSHSGGNSSIIDVLMALIAKGGSFVEHVLREIVTAPFEVAGRLFYRPNTDVKEATLEHRKTAHHREINDFHLRNCMESFYSEKSNAHDRRSQHEADVEPLSSIGGLNDAPRVADPQSLTAPPPPIMEPSRRTYYNMDPARSGQYRSLVVRPHKGELAVPGSNPSVTGSHERLPAYRRSKAASESGSHAAIYRALSADNMNPHGLKQFLGGEERAQ